MTTVLEEVCPVAERSDDLDDLVEQFVDALPPITDEQRRELGQLLSPASA